MPELVAFNVGSNRFKDLLDMSPEFVEGLWRECCFSGFLVGQETLRRMQPLGKGTLIFTGASASMRGKPKFGAFASAKAGLRMFAQAMAREFGPEGIHVAHVVVDGVVDGDRVNKFGGGAGRLYRLSKGSQGSLSTEAIAENYWHLHCQDPTAWTHELDLRPWRESW
ncbi:oxidoreductase, short chain dehydrogenase/reductase family protein [Salinisphaera sp. S4-8]|uniref:SDR family NAD(P)-dependent oxidoreductase n=1 Tax=Salinisphaera sp. S4-8 TaxID=633357 RepID=UPI00333F0782